MKFASAIASMLFDGAGITPVVMGEEQPVLTEISFSLDDGDLFTRGRPGYNSFDPGDPEPKTVNGIQLSKVDTSGEDVECNFCTEPDFGGDEIITVRTSDRSGWDAPTGDDAVQVGSWECHIVQSI
ncbi:uncharacterized protein APUU_21391A [Aspergillus puulaauensis]|uniref:Uncharacterized protein n=1 Tax=Aspergillus puulaauensis TaxID=1220207 RepID=A0A7R7XGN8_9EURO|nr:uncharacterized protein APUU_21391A [Aspergillus puulaauensis]BCS20959.1 hypothetical protein APUU_21391A [Aspergillus puulaauensis]